MVIEAGQRPDDGAQSDATLAESSAGGGFDTGPVPSRVDAGGGYLARQGGGLNWLLLPALFALLLVPRIRGLLSTRR